MGANSEFWFLAQATGESEPDMSRLNQLRKKLADLEIARETLIGVQDVLRRHDIDPLAIAFAARP